MEITFKSVRPKKNRLEEPDDVHSYKLLYSAGSSYDNILAFLPGSSCLIPYPVSPSYHVYQTVRSYKLFYNPEVAKIISAYEYKLISY